MKAPKKNRSQTEEVTRAHEHEISKLTIEALDQEVSDLPSGVKNRLAGIRRQALSASGQEPARHVHHRHLSSWLSPALSAAAALALLVLVFWPGADRDESAGLHEYALIELCSLDGQDGCSTLSEELVEDPAFYENLDFYEWLAEKDDKELDGQKGHEDGSAAMRPCLPICRQSTMYGQAESRVNHGCLLV